MPRLPLDTPNVKSGAALRGASPSAPLRAMPLLLVHGADESISKRQANRSTTQITINIAIHRSVRARSRCMNEKRWPTSLSIPRSRPLDSTRCGRKGFHPSEILVRVDDLDFSENL